MQYPFAGLFSGFTPNTTGTVTAYTQPGGLQVGHRSVTVDAQGNRCELVTSTSVLGETIFFTPLAASIGDAAILARTGSDVPALLGLVGVLVASGAALMVLGGRRRYTG